MAVSHFKIALYLDCKKIAEKPINTVGSISTAGFIMLGKVTRTRGPRSGSASVSPPGLISLPCWRVERLKFGADWGGQMERSATLHHSLSERCCDARPCPDPADLCDFNELSWRGVSPPRLPPLFEVCDQRQLPQPVPEVPSAGCIVWGPGKHRDAEADGRVWELCPPGKVEHISSHRGISGDAGD